MKVQILKCFCRFTVPCIHSSVKTNLRNVFSAFLMLFSPLILILFLLENQINLVFYLLDYVYMILDSVLLAYLMRIHVSSLCS